MLKQLYQISLGIIVVLMVSFAIAEATNSEVVFNDMHDLDGDGIKEKIILSSIIVSDRKSKYKLKIADQVVHGEYETGEDDKPKLEIIDIDKNDTSHEMLLTTIDGMYTCHYTYYNYKDGNLNKLRKLSSGHCGPKPVLKGDGTLIHGIWNNFYVYRTMYKFDPDKNAVSSYYSSFSAIDAQVTAKREIKLFSTTNPSEMVSIVKPGVKLNAILFNPQSNMLLVSDQDGFFYWVNYDSIIDLDGIPFAG